MDIARRKDLEEALLTLNYRVASRAASAWRGVTSDGSEYDLYDGFHDILTHDAVEAALASAAGSSRAEKRIVHTLLGHYLQYRLRPYDNELSMWMRGASADVDGEKIYLKDVLAWCQKKSDFRKRRLLEKETGSLSKFLKTFALGLWEYALELIEGELGYGDYVEYCRDKKGLDYPAYVLKLREVLLETEGLYFEAMEAWARKSMGVPLERLNRFDGIYMLALGELDHIFPDHIPLRRHLGFFADYWGVDVEAVPGLHLDVDYSPGKGSQAMSFTLSIPREIHVVMNPQGGWIDLETLFHETGHALSTAFTSPDLPAVDKDFYTSNTLSESYAFLLQNMCFSPVFLEKRLGLRPAEIDEAIYYKALKDMSLFRRYATKFLAEYEMFRTREIESGHVYASLLEKHTGFSYRPETHLFDLVPELYSLDYAISWTAEASIAAMLKNALGDEWMFKREAAEILKGWWAEGNRYELDEFLTSKGVGAFDFKDITRGWTDVVGSRGGRRHR